jgi:hypothetical protein
VRSEKLTYPYAFFCCLQARFPFAVRVIHHLEVDGRTTDVEEKLQ